MKNERIDEELSAYLDGEAENPGEIERLLREDAAVAKRYAELSRMSVHLRSLPEPDVPAAFATRVMAHVREAKPARGWLRFGRLAPIGAIAALAIAAVVVLLTPDEAIAPEPDELASAVLDLRHDDPEGMMNVIAGEADEGMDDLAGEILSFDIAALTPGEEPAAEPGDVMDDLAAEEQFYEEQMSLDRMLDSLDESEAEAFRALLLEYAERGIEVL